MLRLQSVSKKFCSITVIDDISIEIESGEFIVLLGPIGSGKTVLLRLIAGLERVDSGEIVVENKGDSVAFIGKGSRVNFRKSILKNLSLPSKARKQKNYLPRVEKIAREFGLNLKAKPTKENEFLVEIARSTTVMRNILLIDTENATSIIKKYKHENQIIILATSDVDFAKELNEKTILLNNGRLVAFDYLDKMDKEQPFIKLFLEIPSIQTLA